MTRDIGGGRFAPREPLHDALPVLESACAALSAGHVPAASLHPDLWRVLPTALAGVRRLQAQWAISEWAEATFGPVGSNARVAARANEEMAELLRALTADDCHLKAAEEIADIVIILYRLASRLGVDLHAEVDRKMAVNRARTWKLDGSGHGYHVRPEKEVSSGHQGSP